MNDFNREENFAAFVEKKSEYYLAKWDVFENSSEKVSWNWAAFFFSAYWMIYRKMYIPAILVFTGTRVFKYIIALGGGKSYRMTTLLVSVAIGLLGNWIYYVYASRKIGDVADTAGTDDPSVIGRTLRDIGGTSWLWVFGLMIIGNIVDKILTSVLARRAVSLDHFDEDTFWDII
jgi:hypothetical protein